VVKIDPYGGAIMMTPIILGIQGRGKLLRLSMVVPPLIPY